VNSLIIFAADATTNLNALGLGNTDLIETIGRIINIILGLVGVVAVIMLIIGGFKYTISGGNDKQVEAAKNQITYAVIGIVITLLAAGIVQFVLAQVNSAIK
jgi:hypothetical protein